MISINNLLPYYPVELQKDEYKMFILKEYLQYKVLNIIYNSPWGKNLIFIGGTCLRLMYDFRRFSDDIDFDFHGKYNLNDHMDMCEFVCKELIREGVDVETDKQKKIREGTDAMTCYINFPGILYKQGIDNNPNKKLFIKIDAQYQDTGTYKYNCESRLLNKFDIVRLINIAPVSVLYSMKLCAILSRAKGRDFYDIMELINKTKPDKDFLLNRLAHKKNPITLNSSKHLKELILEKLENIDWSEKISEVSKYLHKQAEIDKVKYFKIFITQTDPAKLLPDLNLE